jgi:Uma2 family endonuclease
MTAQVIDGELHLHPRPASPHAVAASGMGMDIGSPFFRGRGGPGGWVILDEPELHLGLDILVPDLAGWRRERMPAIPDVPYFELAPDWVCEVLSPSTRRIDLVAKARVYAREGIPWLWFVDPVARFVEVRRLEAGGWFVQATAEGDEPARLPPFEAVELDVGGWFLSPAEGDAR